MIVIPNHIVLLFTPRTGSRALQRAVAEHPDAKVLKGPHHVHPDAIDCSATSLGASGEERVLAVTRNPYSHAASWFSHSVLKHEPWRNTLKNYKNFLRTQTVPWYFVDRLNVYSTVPNVTLIHYNKDLSYTLRDLMKHIKTIPTQIADAMLAQAQKQVGGKRPVPYCFEGEAKAAVEERFPEDIKLWRDLCQNC